MYASFSILHTSVTAFLPLLFLLGCLRLTWASSTLASHSALELLRARMLDLVVLQTSSFIWCHTWLPRLRFHHSVWKCIAWSIRGADADDFINFKSMLRNGEEDERAQVSSPTQIRMWVTVFHQGLLICLYERQPSMSSFTGGKSAALHMENLFSKVAKAKTWKLLRNGFCCNCSWTSLPMDWLPLRVSTCWEGRDSTAFKSLWKVEGKSNFDKALYKD